MLPDETRFTALELMEMELPPVRWVVPGILPEGVTVLGGKPKMGKSWMAFALCISKATGGTALGTIPVEQGACLYLALEDNRRRLQKRLNKLLAGGSPPADLHIATRWPRLDQGGVEAIEEFVDNFSETTMVVIDTLKKVRPRTNTYRNIYDEDYEALEPLQTWAGERGIAVLVVHHLRQMPADDPLEAISGSNGLVGGMDGALVLNRERGRADAFLYVDGRDIEEPQELALRWDPNVASWTLMGDADEYRLSEARTEIIRVLEEHGAAMTPTEVADVLGKNNDAVRQTLRRMAADNQLTASDGRYGIISHPGHAVTEGEAA